jgi:hypothetical protein
MERQEMIAKYLWDFPENGHLQGRKGFWEDNVDARAWMKLTWPISD